MTMKIHPQFVFHTFLFEVRLHIPRPDIYILSLTSSSREHALV